MKKLETKSLRLQLNRETLRTLERADLTDVHGAATIITCAEGSCPRTSPTCLC